MSAGAASVSVIVPIHNDGRWVAEAIDSILGQTHRPDEIIVVDDGSTDDSAAVVGRYRADVTYDLQPHRGAGAARNRGVELARGALLAFLDADDLWVENKLERQAAALAAEPALEAIMGHIEQFQVPPADPRDAGRFRFVGETLPGYLPSTLLVRAAAFHRVGPFEVSLRVGEFIEWFARAVDVGLRCRMAPDVVARRRVHDGNAASRAGGDPRTAYARVMMDVLRRRRLADPGS